MKIGLTEARIQVRIMIEYMQRERLHLIKGSKIYFSATLPPSRTVFH